MRDLFCIWRFISRGLKPFYGRDLRSAVGPLDWGKTFKAFASHLWSLLGPLNRILNLIFKRNFDGWECQEISFLSLLAVFIYVSYVMVIQQNKCELGILWKTFLVHLTLIFLFIGSPSFYYMEHYQKNWRVWIPSWEQAFRWLVAMSKVNAFDLFQVRWSLASLSPHSCPHNKEGGILTIN